MMSVTFSDSTDVSDPPEALFVDNFERRRVTQTVAFDVSLDGERFLMVRRTNPVRPTRIRVVLNWPEVFGLNDD